jgi:hypothetical protein
VSDIGSTQPVAQPVAADGQVRLFATDPARYFGESRYAMHHLDPQTLTDMQLDAARMRFAELRDRVPVLRTMADELGAIDVQQLDDLAPLLFQHSVYKSYPASLLLRGRFDELTRWLDRLTAVDLSGVSVDGCDSIDAWLDALDAQCPLRVAHSSGTTGTMSFLPRTEIEWDRFLRSMRCGLFMFSDPRAERDHSQERFDIVWPSYRTGRTGFYRAAQFAHTHFAGGEDSRLHVLHPGRLSSDAMFLAGRIRAAEARGELEQLDVGPALRARQEEFVRTQQELGEAMPRYFAEVIERLRGERVWVFGTWTLLYEMASYGLERDIRGVFAPDTVITTGGGTKGGNPPDDWIERVCEFAGVEQMQQIYGMTELMGCNHACENARYHLDPTLIPFVLDPDDGTPRPRRGVQSGRMAFYDLMAETYWGGFITGDAVTLDWTLCPCGQTTPHLDMRIERFSDQRQGDDKITCAAADEAHRAALSFLTSQMV